MKSIGAYTDCAPINLGVEEVGYVNCFGTMAGIFVIVVGFGAVLLIIYGAKARHTAATWRLVLD